MGLLYKIHKNFLAEFDKPDLDNFLDYIYYVMFTGYIKKTLIETKKSFFIRERTYKDRTMYIDSHETQYIDSCELEEADLGIDSEIEDKDIFNSLQELTSKQKIVLCDYYLYGKTEVEISKELKIKKQAVNRIRQRALTNIKNFREAKL